MKTLIVDGVDYSNLMTKRGYTVGYKKVYGPNSSTTMDGKDHKDLLRLKAVINVSLKILDDDNLSIILNAQAKQSVVVTYHDTMTKADKTVNMEVTTPPTTILLEREVSYWGSGNSGVSITLEEV